jgi:F-type H+-transporting ATPase subunit a
MEMPGIVTVFHVAVSGDGWKIPVLADWFPEGIPITETVIVSWLVMGLLVVLSLVVKAGLKEKSGGLSSVVEAGVVALNDFAKTRFGKWSGFLAPYMGTLFLFIFLSNIIVLLSPVELKIFGHEFTPPFSVRPPTRDVNVTVPLAALTILLTLVLGIASRRPLGWVKNLFTPVAFMLPFNLLDYATRLLSLSLRLFGNILGGFVIMEIIYSLLPLGLPVIFSLYFDLFDGLMQSAIFVFLSCIYINEACGIEHA